MYCSGGPLFRVLLDTHELVAWLIYNIYSKERWKVKSFSVGVVVSGKSEGRSTIKVSILGKEPQASEIKC